MLNISLQPKLAILILGIFIFFSCNDDSEESTSYDIVMTTYASSPSSFLLITNQDQDVLFSKVGLGEEEIIAFDASLNEEIDFTYGITLGGTQESFLIDTYRNISPDFVFTSDFTCEDSYDIDEFNVARKVLTIENFKGEIFYSPLREEEIFEDKIQLSGIAINDDNAVTFWDENTGIYKSVLIEKDDWVAQDDGTYSLTLNANDIPEAKEHIVKTNVSSAWSVLARVVQMDESRVELSVPNGKFQEEASHVRLLMPEELEYQSIRLNFNSPSSIGYQYNIRDVESFPTNVGFVNTNFDFVVCDPTQYKIDNRLRAAQIRVDYKYINNNHLSTWRIFQKKDVVLEYTLPTLPEEYVEQVKNLETVLQNPQAIFARFIQAEELNSTEKYFESFDHKNFCVEHSDSFDGKAF